MRYVILRHSTPLRVALRHFGSICTAPRGPRCSACSASIHIAPHALRRAVVFHATWHRFLHPYTLCVSHSDPRYSVCVDGTSWRSIRICMIPTCSPDSLAWPRSASLGFARRRSAPLGVARRCSAPPGASLRRSASFSVAQCCSASLGAAPVALRHSMTIRSLDGDLHAPRRSLRSPVRSAALRLSVLLHDAPHHSQALYATPGTLRHSVCPMSLLCAPHVLHAPRRSAVSRYTLSIA